MPRPKCSQNKITSEVKDKLQLLLDDLIASLDVNELDANQTQTELEGKFSEGQRITIHNGDIYVGGYFQNGSCFWKNGSKTNLTINADSMSWGGWS